MKFEAVPIASLVVDPANARKHSAKNLEAIKGSLARFAQQKPVVVGKGNVVVAGNGTLEAARALGWTEIGVVRTALEGPDAIAFALADNRTAELAEWDLDVLGPTLKSLGEMDFDLGAIGFDDDFCAKVMPEHGTEGLTDPDEVPEHVETRVKPGDLWVLGKHRLLCGDSTNVQHVERLMGGEKADMVFTDPPYGMSLDTDFSSMAGKGNKYRPVIGDDQEFDPRFFFEFFATAREHFWFGADYYAKHLPKDGSWAVWDKSTHSDGRLVISEKQWGSDFELCWSRQKHKRAIARVMWRAGLGEGMSEERKGRNNSPDRTHPTQKPIMLAEWFFERWGKPDDLVADLFLGSGSTLIACQKTGRRCFGMEVDAHYCSVVLERWERFTGEKATLDAGTGQA